VGGFSSQASSLSDQNGVHVDPLLLHRTLQLSGPDWWIQAAGADGQQIPAQVPGNIQADVERAHLLKPLWYGVGDPRLADVATKDWWYRKEFDLPPQLKNKRLRLIFEGIDFEAEIWLNDQLLGTRAGQFRRFEFDVADVVKIGEKNKLAVKITRMPEEIGHCLAVSDGALSGADTPNNFVDCYIHTRQVLQGLKSVTNFAYDWGFNVYTLGIWQDVWLEASGSSAIQWVQIETQLSDDYRQATVKVRIEIDSQVATKARASFRVQGHGPAHTVTVENQLAAGNNIIEAQLPLHEPALWWPNGQGEQPLYDLQVRLAETSFGDELDSKSARFAIREIRWQQTEGAPRDFINPYSLLVNGRPIRMMGSDVVPPDLFFGRNAERAPRLVQLAQAAGMNTLRIWGGGVTLPPQFYDRADELGIMVSQEFPLANSWPETGPVFLANLRDTVTSLVKVLRNHPSIIEWVGGNEMPWQQGTDHPALHVLEQVCADNDSRLFRATDPMQGSLHGPWNYEPRSHYQHYNAVLESLSVAHPDLGVNTMNAMRYGEFGTQSPANLEVFLRDIPPESQWPLDDLLDPVLIRKNVVQAAFTPLYWLMKPVIQELFGPMDDLQTLVEAGQFIGAEGLRYAYDELRRKGKRIGGITSWDFNEPWTNGAGSYLVDYDGRTVMKYDFVRQALAPVSLTLRYNSILYDPAKGLNAALFLTSDAPTPVTDLSWQWVARDRRGVVITQAKGSSPVLPQQAIPLAQLNIKPPAQTALGPIVVELQLKDKKGALITERLHIFGSDNAFLWPLDGLLRNSGSDGDDQALMASGAHTIRVLWIKDANGERYQDVAWSLRRFGIHSTCIPATPEAIEKAGATLAKDYDAIWLGEGDYRKATTLAARLGTKSFAILAEAVAAGVGLGVEGGWGGYADAGLEGTPLAAILPVTFAGSGNAQRRSRGAVTVTDAAHPLVSGKLMATFPKVSGYNLVKPKDSHDVVLATTGGDSLLVAGTHGKARALAYMSGIVGNNGWVNNPMVDGYEGNNIDWGWSLESWDGFPFFMARLLFWLSGASNDVVSGFSFPEKDNRLVRPVRRTQLEASRGPVTTDGVDETIDIQLKNTGQMTALFCEPHPLLEYRTDITMLNNHAFVPPGEARSITLRAPIKPGLSLAQIGWQISCWNAGDIVIQPNDDVLLSMGRQDAMCREYQVTASEGTIELKGNRPNCSQLPWLLRGPGQTIRFFFDVSHAKSTREARLRIHTADQHKAEGPLIEVSINGQIFEQKLKPGLGIQLSDPAHLAFPATAQFTLPAGMLRSGANVLAVRVSNTAWFTWDAMDLLALPEDTGK
jgi:beta-mannosidase